MGLIECMAHAPGYSHRSLAAATGRYGYPVGWFFCLAWVWVFVLSSPPLQSNLLVLSRRLGYLMVSQTAQDAYTQVNELRPQYQTTIIFLPSLTAKEYVASSAPIAHRSQVCSHGVALFQYSRLIWFDDHQNLKKYERLKLYFCLESSDCSWRSLS